MNKDVQKLLQNGVRLYYRILKLHRKVLPPKMRTMGDYYVRQQFKHHHEEPQAEFYQKFFNKWEKYYNQLNTKGLQNAAKSMEKRQEQLLTSDQKQALRLLKEGISKNKGTF